MSVLRRYFGWLAARGVIDLDPTLELSVPGGGRRLPRVLRADELSQLLDERVEPAATVDQRDDAVLELLYGSGLRVSELCGLDVDDLDLARRRVTVWGKGARQRSVPLSEPGARAGAAVVRGRSARRSWARAPRRRSRSSSTHVTCGSHPGMFDGSSTAVRRFRRTRTHFDTRLRLIFSTEVPI